MNTLEMLPDAGQFRHPSDLGARIVAEAVASDLEDRARRMDDRGFPIMALVARTAAHDLRQTARGPHG